MRIRAMVNIGLLLSGLAPWQAWAADDGATETVTPYSATPRVKAGKPVLEVLVVAPDGKRTTVDVDLQTSKTTKH
jgi:hypothetical protein